MAGDALCVEFDCWAAATDENRRAQSAAVKNLVIRTPCGDYLDVRSVGALADVVKRYRLAA